jgi:probable HAF family extracellular repeat protein
MVHQRPQHTLLTKVAMVLCLVVSADASAQTLEFVDLGQSSGVAGYPSVAYSINDAEQVVGSITTSEGNERAFLWDGSAATFLEPLPGFTSSTAASINDRGEVVGYSYSIAKSGNAASSQDSAACYWPKGESIPSWLFPEGTISQALAINNSGQIAGSVVQNGQEQAFFLQQKGSQPMILPSSLSSGGVSVTVSAAISMNDRGQVVGRATTASGPGDIRAFYWERGNESLIDISPAGSTLSLAFAINDLGQIVGTARNGKEYRPFRWDPGSMKSITLEGFGGSVSYARSINNLSQIVGVATMLTNAAPRNIAAFWFGGDKVSLHDNKNLQAATSASASVALDINNAGAIVGYYINGTGTHAFLLRPPR